MNAETACKGRIAELKVEQRALELGLTLCKPIMDARYDYILDNNGTLERVQVKYASYSDKRTKANSVRIGLRRVRKSYNGIVKITKYGADEVDVLLAYVPQIDKIFRFEAEDFCGKSGLMINLDEQTGSGQVKGIRFAKDYIW